MSVQSRYHNSAHKIELKTASARSAFLKPGKVEPPVNRKERRAQESALRSKRKLYVHRRKR